MASRHRPAQRLFAAPVGHRHRAGPAGFMRPGRATSRASTPGRCACRAVRCCPAPDRPAPSRVRTLAAGPRLSRFSTSAV